MTEILCLPVLQDNYIWLLIDDSGKTAAIDPALAAPVINALEERGLTLDYILNTHHHWDHTGGNLDLKARYGCTIIGAAHDAHRIPGIDRKVSDGDSVAIGAASTTVMGTPGHTSGHICYHFADNKALFCGDTLFSMGCGRLFEGTPEQMWNSLSKIMGLPDDTMVYCAHEYTEDNGTFGLMIEPDNKDLQARMAEVRTLRAQNKPTIPVTLATEKKTNIFLRAGSAAQFGFLRHKKDTEFD
ncbi:MAG: hydroxyacylglutathione hydrolase [Rhodospirillales bacterium]|nr:hydroxyacylglutathione hydrolase [Rhodospirillales bacterium]